MEDLDEEYIEDYVCYTGYYQVLQRMGGVTGGVHNAHGDVVHKAEENTHGEDSEIGDGTWHYILRCLHPSQNSRSEDYAENGEQYS